MPPATKKDFSIILLDINSSFKEIGTRILLKIHSIKCLNRSKDLTKLILFNSKETGNLLALSYKNILEFGTVTTYNPKLIYDFIENAVSYDENNNWIKALIVAIENLKRETESVKGIVNKQLILISDLTLPYSSPPANSHDLDIIIHCLNKDEIFFYIIGPNVDFPIVINSTEDIKNYRKQVQLPTKNYNFELVKQIIEETENSIICNGKLGIQLIFSYKNSLGKQPWNVPLSIGTKLQLPTQTIKFVDSVTTNQVKLTPNTKSYTKLVWVTEEDQSVEVDYENVIKGVSRHGKFIPIVDERIFKSNTFRCFNIIGFTLSHNVPEYLMRGEDTYYVVPKFNNPTQNVAFNTLIDCLSAQDKCAIARRVYNNNNKPKFMVLVPKPNYKPKCFLLTGLPYADDIVVDYKTSIFDETKVDKNSQTENNVICQYLHKIEEENSLPLGICMKRDLNEERIVDLAADKLMEKQLYLDEVNLDYFNIQSSEEMLNDIQNVWCERELGNARQNVDDVDSEEDEFDY